MAIAVALLTMVTGAGEARPLCSISSDEKMNATALVTQLRVPSREAFDRALHAYQRIISDALSYGSKARRGAARAAVDHIIDTFGLHSIEETVKVRRRVRNNGKRVLGLLHSPAGTIYLDQETIEGPFADLGLAPTRRDFVQTLLLLVHEGTHAEQLRAPALATRRDLEREAYRAERIAVDGLLDAGLIDRAEHDHFLRAIEQGCYTSGT